MPPIRVAIADECLIYRKGLVALLASEKDLIVVGEVSAHAEILACVRAGRPHVLLFDCKLLSTQAPTPFLTPTRTGTRSIMIVGTPLSREQGLRLLERYPGLSGIVARGVGAEDLVNAVRVVHSGGNWTGFDGASTASDSPRFEDRHELELTGRHVQVARLLARGCCNKEIAGELGISDATVKKHVRALLARLGLKDRLQIALHVAEHWELFADFGDPGPRHQRTRDLR